jgi:hypothetical protein
MRRRRVSYAEEDDTANDRQYRRPPSLHTFTYIVSFLADATHALCIVEVKQTSKVAGAIHALVCTPA